MPAHARAAARPDRSARGAPGYRPDIEGLRAVAIGLVLVYHGAGDLLPGGFVGVDVFFVISGFLITGILVRELERDRQVSLVRFYARRAKRLLPATAVVLVATSVLTWATTSPVVWRVFAGDIVGAAFYVVNWVLAGRAVDYLAEDVDVSPVQHFWSLAVEEQFYVVWPLLIVAAAWWLRRRPQARTRPVLTLAIGAVIVGSLVCSVLWTSSSPSVAFFATPTRLWELGIGALVAIGAPLWERLPAAPARAATWAGLAAVLASGFLLDSSVPWPGAAALWPTLATAVVIVGGVAAGRSGATVLLGARPMVWLGGLSYSLYLWHWPLLVAAEEIVGGLGRLQGLLVVAASLVPAYLCNRLVENPIRFAPSVSRSHGLALSLGGGFTMVGVVAGLVLALAVPVRTAPPGEQQAVGAGSLLEDGATTDGAAPGSVGSLADIDWWVPDATEAIHDVPDAYADGCQQDQVSAEPIVCEWGDLDGDLVVAAVGDSKLVQWQPALDPIAAEQGWHVYSISKSACAFGTGRQVNEGAEYTSCTEWNERTLEEVLALQPDVVLVGNRINEAMSDPPDPSSRTGSAMADGLAERWQQLIDAGIPVVVLLDNPNPGDLAPVYECVAEHPDDLAACTFDREEGLSRSGARVQLEAAERVEGVSVVDMNDLICPTETCVPVIGNVLVYRQTSHMTATYATSLREPLAERLVPVVEDATTGR